MIIHGKLEGSEEKMVVLDIVGTVYHLVIYIYIYVVQQDTQCGLNE